MGRKKGTVEFDESPPDFNHENPYGNPVAFFEMREHIVREKWIEIEKSKILRERVKWCYRALESTTSRIAATSSASTSSPPAASDGVRTAAVPPYTALRSRRLSPSDVP